MNLEEQVKNKFLVALEDWCNHFMVIGFSNETPRYSQIFEDDDTVDYLLKSTVSEIWYRVELTDEEKKFIRNKRINQELWNWWKRIRTEHLVMYYPTIKPY